MIERRCNISGGWLNAAVVGTGETDLVFLHGVSRAWRDFDSLIRVLEPRFRIHALDLRGHGDSHRKPGEYLIRHYALDVAEYLAAYTRPNAILWGHSMGALVAGTAAASVGSGIGALILEDPPAEQLVLNVSGSRFALQFEGIRSLLQKTSNPSSIEAAMSELPVRRPSDGAIVKFRELRGPGAIRFSAECLARMDPALLEPLVQGRWLEGLNWHFELRRIACRSLLLVADTAAGGMLGEAEAGKIVSSMRSCDRKDLAGVGHSIHSLQPETAASIFESFLGGN